MATTTVTGATFEQTVKDNDIVFIDFWAEWCGPCRQFGPIFEKVSEQNPEIVFAKMDTDAEQAFAVQANISSIPTLMAFREGELVFRQPGAMNAKGLTELVEAVKALDMDDVRAQIAAHQAGHPTASDDPAAI